MTPTAPSQRREGFTLVELLVALTVATIFIAFLANITSVGTQATASMLGRLDANTEGKIALDYFDRDFTGLAPTETGRTTLSIVQETTGGGNWNNLPSTWIMFLTRPASRDHQGVLRAVSYRLVYADPMNPGGSRPRASLYRTRVNPVDVDHEFLDLEDLHADFWATHWPDHLAANSGRDLLADYLAGDVVGFELSVAYRDASGAVKQRALPVGAELHWTPLGFEGASLATPNTPISITLSLTSLRPEGAELLDAGGLTLAEAIERHGEVVHRTFPLRVSLGN